MSIQVQTTQNVTLTLREAGLGPRILAYLLDGLFIFIWIMGWIVVASYSNRYLETEYFFILIWVPILFYDLLFECFNKGQTPGKKILRIRVVNTDGTTPSFGGYLIRWLFRLVDITITSGALAVIMIAVTDKSQRLGDYLAGTTIITLKPEAESYTLDMPDFNFKDDYSVSYPDILEKLNDKDISTVRSILNDYRYYNDTYTQKNLADKIKEVTDYVYDGSDRDFLKKVVDDYNYMSIQ